jgi:AraC family transcriptional regulator, arabinose operon regulatory protein
MKIKNGFEGERYVIVPYQFVSTMPENPLVGDVFIHSLGHFPNAQHHYINRPEGRNEYIFIYCLSGCGWVSIREERCTLTENQFIIISPGVPHSYGADDVQPWSIYWIHFMGKKAGLFANGFERPITIAPSEASRIENRLNLFEEIYTVLHSGFSYENLCYANLCLLHFLGTFKFRKQYVAVKKIAEYSGTVINGAVYFMHENISNKITIKEFADYSGYSESYFYRIFIRETGYPPIEYFNRLKIKKACEYLRHSNMKIIQISHTLGFNDQYYFSRTFTRITGLSPMKYRQSTTEVMDAVNGRLLQV